MPLAAVQVVRKPVVPAGPLLKDTGPPKDPDPLPALRRR